MLRFLTVPVVGIVVLAGVWFFGGVVTDDFRASMALTVVWFAAAGSAAVAIGWRRRRLALPVIGAYLAAAVAVGGYLGWSTLRDRVVHEQVAVASAATGNTLLARGTFAGDAHATSGTAEVIRLAAGGRVLALDLDTSAGPDLRVYLARPGDVGDHEDLGGLKGNRGTQQYSIPAGIDTRRYRAVVVYCRAFSVAFGTAILRSTGGANGNAS